MKPARPRFGEARDAGAALGFIIVGHPKFGWCARLQERAASEDIGDAA